MHMYGQQLQYLLLFMYSLLYILYNIIIFTNLPLPLPLTQIAGLEKLVPQKQYSKANKAR